MCNRESRQSKSPIGKVSRGFSASINPSTTPSRGAKSVLTKLKQLVKKVIVIHGLRRRNGRRNADLRIASRDELFAGETERENAANENESNFANTKSNMTYTIEELKDIVDDNLANELREMRARETILL